MLIMTSKNNDFETANGKLQGMYKMVLLPYIFFSSQKYDEINLVTTFNKINLTFGRICCDIQVRYKLVKSRVQISER